MDDISVPTEIPLVHIKKRVTLVKHYKNLLIAYLEDGTILRFNHNQLINLGKIPSKNDLVKLTMERHPSDTSSTPSRIRKIEFL